MGLSMALQAAVISSTLSWPTGKRSSSMPGSGDARSLQEARMLQKAASETVLAASILVASTSSHQPSCPSCLCQPGTRPCPGDRPCCEAVFNLCKFGAV